MGEAVVAGWKSIYLDQLFLRSFVPLSCQLKSVSNPEGQQIISSDLYPLTLQTWLDLKPEISHPVQLFGSWDTQAVTRHQGTVFLWGLTSLSSACRAWPAKSENRGLLRLSLTPTSYRSRGPFTITSLMTKSNGNGKIGYCFHALLTIRN